MKLSFSTLGCPSWNFKEIFTTAKDLGYDGVELRGISDKIYVPDLDAFDSESIDKTKDTIKKIGLNIPVLDSGAVIADFNRAKDSFVEACDYINLASKLGVKYVRIMGTGEPQETPGNFELASKLFTLLCEYGKLYDVTPLIETNGKLCKSDEMLKFVKSIESDNLGVLWDIHHTIQYAKEKPAYTVEKLGKYIKHVHVKDSVIKEDGNVEYKMMGYGNIPVSDTIKALKEIDFDGFVSLEWVKRWKPDLQEPGIVFAHYISYMKTLL